MPKEIFQAGIKSAGKENARLIYKGLKSLADECDTRADEALTAVKSANDRKAAGIAAETFVNEMARQDVYLELMDMIVEVMKEEDK